MLVRLGNIYVNPQHVRALMPRNNSGQSTIEFDAQHKIGVDLSVEEVAAALDPELVEYDDD
jgi:hypothetical protein